MMPLKIAINIPIKTHLDFITSDNHKTYTTHLEFTSQQFDKLEEITKNIHGIIPSETASNT